MQTSRAGESWLILCSDLPSSNVPGSWTAVDQMCWLHGLPSSHFGHAIWRIAEHGFVSATDCISRVRTCSESPNRSCNVSCSPVPPLGGTAGVLVKENCVLPKCPDYRKWPMCDLEWRDVIHAMVSSTSKLLPGNRLKNFNPRFFL
jgi:hypothetical protein